MPTITATADNAKSQVRLDLDFSDIDAPYAIVQRIDPVTGAGTVVRGHGSSTTIAGVAYVPMQAGYKAVLYDTEMPLDQAFYYTASAPQVAMNANTNFANAYLDPWVAIPASISASARLSSTGVPFAQFYSDGTSSNPGLRAEEVPATPGAVWTITAVLSVSTSQSMNVGFTCRDATGSSLTSASTVTSVGTTTTTVTASITTPANTVSVQPFVVMSGTPASSVVVSLFSATLVSTAGSATSAGVSVQSLGSCQLKDPLRPGLNVRVDFAFDPNPQCTPTEGVFFQALDVESRASNSAAFNVNNRSTPVVVSKIRSAATSTLTLVSRTFADRDRLNAILVNGSPLLFQVPSEYGVRDRLLSIGTTSVSRVLPDHRFPIRVFGLPFASVSAPGGPMQGTVGARWQDTCNRYASWGAVNAAGLTWIQVLDGLAG